MPATSAITVHATAPIPEEARATLMGKSTTSGGSKRRPSSSASTTRTWWAPSFAGLAATA